MVGGCRSESVPSSTTPSDLSGLSPADLQALVLRAQSLLKRHKVPDREDAEAEVVEAFLVILRDKGGAPPYGRIRRMHFWPRLKRGARATAEYLRLHAPVAARRKITRQRAYSIMAGVLIRWLERVGVPTGPGTIAKHLDKMPALMDQAFPGYVESNLLDWVFQARQ